MTTTQLTPTRNWTRVGSEYSDTEAKRAIMVAIIDTLEWVELPPKGQKIRLGFMQGEAIKTAITEFRLPRVDMIAENGLYVGVDRLDSRESVSYALYGIQCHYTNGKSRIYLLDRGSDVVPVASDIWPDEHHLDSATILP